MHNKTERTIAEKGKFTPILLLSSKFQVLAAGKDNDSLPYLTDFTSLVDIALICSMHYAFHDRGLPFSTYATINVSRAPPMYGFCM